jgi:putative ABC transport system permease protein
MRWIKLLRDVKAESGRAVLMLAAVGFALFAVTAMLAAYGIVTREVTRNYMSTNPASATIDVSEVTPEMLEAARAYPGISDAEARSVVEARVKVRGEWMRMLLFVVDDFAGVRMNLFVPYSGAAAPADGAMLVEKVAAPLIGAVEGQAITIKTPHGPETAVRVDGLVHDTTLAPAWQEQSGYGYISRATLAMLGEPPVLDELRILVPGVPTQADLDRIAMGLAEQLKASGADVHGVKAPPPGRHPHGGQIAIALATFLSFAVLALALAAILVAAVLAATLARQSREIGIMKAVGARSGQIAGMYVALLLGLGVVSLAVSVPPGLWAGGRLSVLMADTMNFTIADFAPPAWVYAVVVAAGILMPLAAAVLPILKASRITVREAISASGSAAGAVTGAILARILSGIGRFSLSYVLAVRNSLRRPGRLALSIAMLATAGGLFITALSVRNGWQVMAAHVLTDRKYDLELTFSEPVTGDAVRGVLAPIAGIETAELWGYEQAALTNRGTIDLMRTYPDGGHGSFAVLGVPDAMSTVALPVRGGRWLEPGDTDAIVLGQGRHLRAGTEVGDRVTLSVEGKPSEWRIVGFVREIGGGGAYVPKAAFDRLYGTADAGKMLRIRLAPGTDRQAAIEMIESAFNTAALPVERSAPLTMLYEALVGHVEVPVRMIVAAAVLLAAIGGLGLASMMTVNVLERTREIGIMKAIGASPAVVLRTILGEAVTVAVLSWLVALLVAAPLILAIGRLAAGMFGSALPFLLPLPALALWLGIILVIAAVASIWPASRAARLVVREALAYT